MKKADDRMETLAMREEAVIKLARFWGRRGGVASSREMRSWAARGERALAGEEEEEADGNLGVGAGEEEK